MYLANVLLERGANPSTSINAVGQTYLCHIAQLNMVDVMKLMLLHHVDLEIITAAANGSTACLDLLLQAGADPSAREVNLNTALHAAINFGRKECVALLLKYKSDKDAKNVVGFTPLHLAAGNGHEEFTGLLVDTGADCSIKDKIGRTPMDVAVLGQHAAVVNLLKSSWYKSSFWGWKLTNLFPKKS
jgi:ankyrin repeat protein